MEFYISCSQLGCLVRRRCWLAYVWRRKPSVERQCGFSECFVVQWAKHEHRRYESKQQTRRDEVVIRCPEVDVVLLWEKKKKKRRKRTTTSLWQTPLLVSRHSRALFRLPFPTLLHWQKRWVRLQGCHTSLWCKRGFCVEWCWRGEEGCSRSL